MFNVDYNQATILQRDQCASFQFDQIVGSSNQLWSFTSQLATNFLTKPIRQSDNLILNVADCFNTNNIGGFNLANFKLKYMENFAEDVVKDYLQSLVGTFIQQLFEGINLKTHALYFAFTKFDNDMGYSLIDVQPQTDQPY